MSHLEELDCDEREPELVLVAMEIILNAGNARNKMDDAITLAKKFDFEASHGKIVEAKEDIRLAHLAQTSIIQNEMSGIKYEPSLLFIHAQDTLMTIKSEVTLTKNMIELFEITIQQK